MSILSTRTYILNINTSNSLPKALAALFTITPEDLRDHQESITIEEWHTIQH